MQGHRGASGQVGSGDQDLITFLIVCAVLAFIYWLADRKAKR